MLTAREARVDARTVAIARLILEGPLDAAGGSGTAGRAGAVGEVKFGEARLPALDSEAALIQHLYTS